MVLTRCCCQRYGIDKWFEVLEMVNTLGIRALEINFYATSLLVQRYQRLAAIAPDNLHIQFLELVHVIQRLIVRDALTIRLKHDTIFHKYYTTIWQFVTNDFAGML